MGVYKFQCTLEHDSALPRDHAVNVLYFDVITAFDIAEIEDVCDDIQDAYADTVGSMLSKDLTGVMTIKVYDLDGGQPRFQKTYPAFAVNGGATAAELAICLSYAASDDPSVASRRRMGRIFIGPLGSSDAARPNSYMRDLVLDLGERLAQVGTALGVTWHLRSQRDQSTHKIESIWVDDAWDVQRRRGLRPTLREVRDVQ